MKQEIKSSAVSFVEGKRVCEMEVVNIFDKSDDMKSKAKEEREAAELQYRREVVIARYRAAASDAEKERLMLQLETIDAKIAETAAKIRVYEKYLQGYDESDAQ